MRVCPKCGDYCADRLLAFCLADGTPLVEVDPASDTWDQAARIIEQKQGALKTQQQRPKWRRVMFRAMLMTTMVVSVAAFNRSFSVTVEKPGELCIETFNDLNGDGKQDAGEPGLSEFVFLVSRTGVAKTLTTGDNGAGCAVMPVGTYTVVERMPSGWTATTQPTQSVTITAGQVATLSFGSRQEGKLCIETFNDLNGDGKHDASEPGLSGFVFQASRTEVAKTLTTGDNGAGCAVMPVGTYTVVERPPSGWTATTQTTQTVTITAGQIATLSFGSRQEGELCIVTFDDLNGNSEQDAGEPGLSGFVFQVSGTGFATTLTTGPNGVGRAALPVGKYTVVETSKPRWTATTATKRTVRLIANQTANVFFGHTKSDTVCSDADKDRERQIIRDRYDASWRRIIEGERDRIIAESGTKYSEASLGRFDYQFLFRRCMAVTVVLGYEWRFQGAVRRKPVPGKRRFDCTKTQGIWNCR